MNENKGSEFFWLLMMRLFGLVIPSVALSSIVCGLSGFIPSDVNFVTVIVIITAIIFFIINAVGLRHLYVIAMDKGKYFVISFTAYGIYMVLNALVYVISKDVYAWSFLPAKFLHYSVLGLQNWQSAAVFHAIMLALVPIMCIKDINLEMKQKERKDFSRFDLRYLFFSGVDKIVGNNADEEYRPKKRRRQSSDGRERDYDEDYGRMRRRRNMNFIAMLRGIISYRKTDDY